MKKLLFGFIFLTSAANATQILEPQELQNLTNTICSQHSDSALCVKAFYKVISYAKENDDYFYYCQKSKDSGMSTDKELCNQSKMLRDFIDQNAN
ncbi:MULTISPECIES: hypothetical protein [Klebsiella pneumoniae complex]|uniref:hypothetical protein n=1 Tax=Klebsiella pneumoniae complex TaxID=3390273 RepID=UPI000E201624|nr:MULTISPECIES: hypothetical protein [Klebsiella]MCI8018469.1 hypothetical protein [Klebsiella pneumoniae]HCB2065792.1 hypothetical protein [Klebsiella pneumoniae]